MEEEAEAPYGIDRDHAHPKALELAPEDFFWNGGEELSPFGSDEGDMALSEWRDWRKENPTSPALDCLIWTIESVGEIGIEEYNDSLLSEARLKAQLADKAFNELQYIFTLDISVIATGFGQLVDEGLIDLDCKPLIERAIERQLRWTNVTNELADKHKAEYRANLRVLARILQQA
jgi:uncharacterized protein YfeS